MSKPRGLALVLVGVLGGVGCAAARPLPVRTGGGGSAAHEAPGPVAAGSAPAQKGSVTLPPMPDVSFGGPAPLPDLGPLPGGWEVLDPPQRMTLDREGGVSVSIGEPGPVSGSWGSRSLTVFVYDGLRDTSVAGLARLLRPGRAAEVVPAGAGSMAALGPSVEAVDPNGGPPLVEQAWAVAFPDGRRAQVHAGGLTQDELAAWVASVPA